MRRYRRLFRYAWRRWPGLLVILALTTVTSVAAALQPWPLKLLIDYALGDMDVPGWLADPLAALSLEPSATVLVVVAALASLCLFVLNSGLDLGLTWSWGATGQRMVYDLAADLFGRLQRLPLTYHKQASVGDLLSRLTGDSYCVYTAVEGLLVSPARRLLTLASIGVLAWKLDPGLTLLSLVVAPVLGASALYFGKRLKRQSRRNREAQAGLMSFVHQTLTAIPLVQAFTTEDRNRTHFRQLSGQAVRAAERGVLMKHGFELANGLVMTLGTALILFVGGLHVLAGTLTVGSLVVFLAYLKSMQGAFKGLFGLYGNLKYLEASVDRVLEVLDAEEGVRETPDARALPTPARGQITFERVSFAYRPDQPVLREVSLTIEPGETVALVGATGAGKTTLASLIPRFFDPDTGRVLFDGHDVRTLTLESLRRQVALVLQEPFLLPLTVAENIAYGRPGASRSEIEAAAQAAQAVGFIERLPQGYETVLGERGATLSGGQCQRLAIARALLKDAPVVVLDEPTSALDAGTEAGVLEALERLMAGRTVVVIAHRMTTVQRADRIIVVDEGRIVESGTHEALLLHGGTYHDFFMHQFGVALGQEVPA